jgi:Zinc knuckle
MAEKEEIPVEILEEIPEEIMDVETRCRVEQTAMAKAQYLMQSIAEVKVFVGDPGELELFLQRMDQIHQQMIATEFDRGTGANLLGYFISRVDMSVLIDVGATFSSSWSEVKDLLKAKFGGARKSVQKTVLRVLQSVRNRGESVGDFAKDIGDKFRRVKTRVVDTYPDQQEAKGRILIYEELVMELLYTNAPDRIKTSLKMAKPSSVDATIRVMVDEEAEQLEERTENKVIREDRWEKVRRRPQRREAEPWGKKPIRQPEGQREPRKVWAKPEVRRSQPRQGPVKCWKCGQVGHISRDCGGCWECGQDGHLARNCPFIYRRDSRKNSGRRGEPMEVNTTLVKRRGRTWQGTGSDSETGSSRSSSDSEDSRGSAKIVSRKRGEDPRMKTKLRTTCKED